MTARPVALAQPKPGTREPRPTMTHPDMNATTPPPARAPRRDYTFVWLLAAVLVVAGVLLFTGIYFFARYIGQQVSLGSRGRGEQTTVEMQTPVGSVAGGAGAARISELGIRVYPGARPTSREGQISLNIPLAHNVRVVSAEFTTPDAPDQVAAFYGRELGSAATVHRLGDETRVIQKHEGKQKYVSIRPSGHGTEFVLANITEAESN